MIITIIIIVNSNKIIRGTQTEAMENRRDIIIKIKKRKHAY
jgi:hypothetical protein